MGDDPPSSALVPRSDGRLERTDERSAAEDASSIDTATKAAIDQQESKFDDFIQKILKTSGGEGEAAAIGDGAAAEHAAPAGPPALSLAEKLASLSTVGRRAVAGT